MRPLKASFREEDLSGSIREKYGAVDWNGLFRFTSRIAPLDRRAVLDTGDIAAPPRMARYTAREVYE
jgi:hypothetical protein